MTDSRSAHDIQTDVEISTAFSEGVLLPAACYTQDQLMVMRGDFDGLSLRAFREACANMGFRVEIKLAEDHT